MVRGNGTIRALLGLMVLATVIYPAGRALAAPAPPVQWADQFGTSNFDGSSSVASDTSNNIYVSGATSGSLDGPNNGGVDAYLRKYDQTGTTLWTRQFGTASFDNALDVATDTSDNIYVAGSTDGSLGGPGAGGTDAFVRRYDPAGTAVWTRQFGTAAYDAAESVAVDGSGNVYVAGATDGSLGGPSAGDTDVFVRKYDSAGTELWTRQFGTPAIDVSLSSAADPTGNVYVAGYTFGDLEGSNAGGLDAFVRKFDPAGNALWTDQFGTTEFEHVQSASTSASGDLFVAGGTSGSLEGTNAGSGDPYVRKYLPNGTISWTDQFGTASADYANGVATGPTGNVFITGFSDGGAIEGASAGGLDVFTREYDPQGIPMWTDQLGTPSHDESFGLIADGSGNLYVSGYTEGDLEGTNAGGADAFVLSYGPADRTLTVVADGSGTGSVSSAPAGISCNTPPPSSGDCTEDYPDGTPVTLTANPAVGDSVAWSGCDSFAGNSCDVTMSSDRTVTATFVAAACTMFGTSGDDVIEGTPFDDVICALEGDDVVNGRGGDDEIYGGDGSDNLYGDAGADDLHGENGKDYLFGEGNTDELFGGPAGDELFGGPGPDFLMGQDGDDRVVGNAGPDDLDGGLGDDSMRGWGGTDVMDGGDGHDLIMGGSGPDMIEAGEGNNAVIAGEGMDTITTGNGNNEISGGADIDTITSGTGIDVITGGEGNDTIDAGDGNNSVNGGGGNDGITTGVGNDEVHGGDGNDDIDVGGGANTVNAGEGDDTVDTDLTTSGDDEFNLGGGNDTAWGGGGNDSIWGGAGLDTLNGEDGDDTLRGGPDDDDIDGGDGSDTCYQNEGTGSIANCEEGDPNTP